MTDEKKLRLRDCPAVREKVLKAWFRLDESYRMTECESDWVNAGPITTAEHVEKLGNVLHYERDPFLFLSFLSGWEACLLSQKNETPDRV